MSTLGIFPGTAYQPQEEEYFNDGREIALLHFIYNHPKLDEIRGNPQKVIDAIDEYGKTKKYLMNVGEFKSGIVTELIKEVRPQVMVELGGYVGYSAIVFGAAFREAGGKKYYSLEYSPEFGAVISSLVDLAGLHDVVQVEIGTSSSSLRRLHANGTLKKIDMLFLDHLKPLYVRDLKLCEELSLVGPGSVLAADNVVKPGNPPYLKYVRSTVEMKRQEYQKATAGADPLSLPDRAKHVYKTDAGGEVSETDLFGNPNLVYASKFIEGWEPSGVPDAVEITRCTAVEGYSNGV
ncbi:S-adenosyl-L-methionine-dependent methyltransferase [Cryphonectria parasitica EP155]|uniref:catechol O-methyltransferase n=1 Tax=Cryphonectria parasitica (strain ATCC 38755 / EP155) TaxID=660469 RepID=A0A9P5CSC1_CRYP1|nr:S-adenosyl-L-methionine-dependent methyltransferase [Cryphonectria parasitica EP155]KAF3769459.1 S-adenosyl-L-methionine-dependent methyltransferase [Cryphonectria parasitica EP155]